LRSLSAHRPHRRHGGRNRPHGRKVTVGFVLCAVGSIIGLSAQTFQMVLVGRFIQAAGAAVSPATAMIIPIRYFAQEERGRALGMASAEIALGNAVGPIFSA
jgi:MFS transporter, DHA2 family, metal-tetracycline-proton antiporter